MYMHTFSFHFCLLKLLCYFVFNFVMLIHPPPIVSHDVTCEVKSSHSSHLALCPLAAPLCPLVPVSSSDCSS